jgi:hypothetical protein
MHREETKGFGSSAETWRRLKHPGELSVYIAIAKTIGLEMSYINRVAYEYRPDMTFPAAMFVWPRNSIENILTARDAIAQFAVEKNIDLNTAIPEKYLNPKRRPIMPRLDWWDRLNSVDPKEENRFYDRDLYYDQGEISRLDRYKKSHMNTPYVRRRLEHPILDDDYFQLGG